jgi:membrane associated rhomboid family serine protease
MYNTLTGLFHDGAPVTFFIMVTIFLFSTVSLYRPSFFMKLLLHPYSIFKEKEYYRIITADLVHNDLTHLALNEFMLYLCCANLEEFLRKRSACGSWQFLLIYLSSYFAGIIVATIRHRNDFSYSSAGASGSIMGCMFSFMLVDPNFIAFYLPVIGGLKNKYDALLYILILMWYQRRSKNELSNHELHFFGAIGGILATLLLFPDMINITGL